MTLYSQTWLDSLFLWSLIPALQWFKNGQGSDLEDDNYRVYENGSLEMKMTCGEDQDIHGCVATTALGVAENQVYLMVTDSARTQGWEGHHRAAAALSEA